MPELNPQFTEQQLAQQLLASRGIQATPENMSRAIAALMQNPELAARFSQQAAVRTGGRNEPSAQSPIISAFADPFDAAFEKAVNGEQAPQAAQDPSAAVTQPAPPIVPVEQLSLDEAVPQAPTPASVDTESPAALPGQVSHLPSAFDAVAQDAAEREFGIIPIIPAPVPLDKRTGTALVPVDRAAAQVGAQGALPSPPRALRGPQGALLATQRTLSAPQKRLPPPGVEADIGRTIDAQDGPLKESVRAGKPAVEFELDGNRFWVNEDGIIGNDTTKVIVREQGVLDRIKAFLIQNKSRFATLARIL